MSDLSLSAHYDALSITTTAGTVRGSPLVTVANEGATMLTYVEVQIPAGHAGVTGFALSYSGQVIIPFRGADQWIRGDDIVERFDIEFPIGSNLLVLTYNEGTFDHTHYVRLKVDDNAYRNAGQTGIAVPVPVV